MVAVILTISLTLGWSKSIGVVANKGISSTDDEVHQRGMASIGSKGY